ncbi:MAG: hypothetical protein ACK457_02575, partial [Flavobacteriia bacterium]
EPTHFDVVFDLGEGKPIKKVYFDKPEIGATNAIKEELQTFCSAIMNDSIPIVPIEDGYTALDVAHKILDKLKITPSALIDNI